MTFFTAKKTINKMKRQPTEWEKIFKMMQLTRDWFPNYTNGSYNLITKKTIIWRDTCIPMFIAALFRIPKTWKQPKFPLTDEWIKKKCYIYTREYHSAIKENEIMSSATTGVDLEITVLSQNEKDKYHMMSLICGIWNMT